MYVCMYICMCNVSLFSFVFEHFNIIQYDARKYIVKYGNHVMLYNANALYNLNLRCL